MCVVSMITDYPFRLPTPLEPGSPPWFEWNNTQWTKYKELLEKAQEFDKATGQPDCPAEEKAKLLKEMQEHFDKKFAALERRMEKLIGVVDNDDKHKETEHV